MTRLRKVLAAAIPLFVGSLAMAGIQGSSHDFSSSSWSDGEICKPCHTPHNADTTVTGALWAHDLNKAVQNYKYHGGSLTGTDGTTSTDAGTGSLSPVNDFDGASRLCLGCHDGTVALDSFMGKSGTSDGKFMGDADGNHGSAAANLGSSLVNGVITTNTIADLSNDHPVGYTAQLTVSRYGTNLPTILSTFNSMLALKSGQTVYSVSCVTCHDVHTSPDMTKGNGMLRISNANSALCQTCHHK
jgi:hypothetical protein